jgi:hypothetical protein
MPLFAEERIPLRKDRRYRKVEDILQNASNIDFVGPISDDRFWCVKVFLQEWDWWGAGWPVDELCVFSPLEESSNAHPLVIGEGWQPAVRLFVSNAAAANLPVEMPWITVVDDELIKGFRKTENHYYKCV